MMKLFIVCFLYFVKVASFQRVCEAENKYPWSYHGTENGPSHWGEHFPSCNQTDQAPIPILEKNEEPNYPELQFSGFEVSVPRAKVENLGWTVQITPTDNTRRIMTLGYRYYELQNIQFHFGSESDPGAENVVDDVRHPMEIRFNMLAAPDSYFGEVNGILSILVEVDDENSYAFIQITEALANVTYKGDVAELNFLYLRLLFPQMTGGAYAYYLYQKKNSVPPCGQENYAWVILKDVQKIRSDQLDSFLALYSVGKDDASDECKMGPNYRPLQGDRNQPIATGQYHYTPKRSDY